MKFSQHKPIESLLLELYDREAKHREYTEELARLNTVLCENLARGRFRIYHKPSAQLWEVNVNTGGWRQLYQCK